MAEFDLSALSVENAVMPEAKTPGKAKAYDVNPFLAHLRDSKESSTGKVLSVPRSMVANVSYLLRQGAGELGYGIRIVVTTSTGKVLDKDALKSVPESRTVKVCFQATTKRKYTRKPKADETDAS